MRLGIGIVVCGWALAGCDGTDVLKPGDPPDTGADTGDTGDTAADTAADTGDTADTAVASDPRLGWVAMADADATITRAYSPMEVVLAGDVDGDGVDEVAFVAEANTIRVVEAPRTGTVELSAATFAAFDSAEPRYGWEHITPAGDVNGDGLADLLVGSDHVDVLSDYERITACHLLLAPFSGEQAAADVAALTVRGEVNDAFGYSAEALGDIDGDDVPDFAVAAIASSYGEAFTYLVSGAERGEVAAADLDARLVGRMLAGETLAAEDLDGDGVNDLVVGEPQMHADYPEGRFYVVHLPVSGEVDLDDAADARVGGAYEAYFATSMDALGDVDGDGYGDVLVAFAHNDASALVFRGPIVSARDPLDIAWASLETGDLGPYQHPNENVQAAGDVDGDGRADVLIGGPTDPEENDAVFLYYGLEPGTLVIGDPTRTVRFQSDEHEVGWHFAGGDLDGDGLGDVVISGWGTPADDLAFFYGR